MQGEIRGEYFAEICWIILWSQAKAIAFWWGLQFAIWVVIIVYFVNTTIFDLWLSETIIIITTIHLLSHKV